MATFLYRLGRLSFVRRRFVVLLWVVLLGLAGAGAAANSEPGSAEFTIPGTEAQRAFDLLNERYPGSGADGATARVVVRAPEGELITDPAHRATVENLVEDLRTGSDKVAQVADPYESQAISQDRTTAYAQVSYLVKGLELEEADRDALEAAVDTGRAAGLTVEMGGDALLEIPATGITEVIGVAVAAVALVVTLGSLVAAGLPLLTALIGVGVAVATITALTATLDLDSTTPILAMMLGLAVGIDYALFIVSRYRAELADGHPHREAAGRALGTAGSAVVFAGLTVIIALAGLAVVNIPILTKMGLAAAGSVAVAVLIALTMIPALLGFAGDRILPRAARRARDTGPAVPAARRTADDGTEGTTDGNPGTSGRPNMGTRWARWVLRRPLAVLLVGVVGLGALALPAADLELGLPDDGSKPTDTTPRRAYDLLAESFGAGFNGPLMVVVDGRDATGGATAAAGRARDRIADLDDVAVVTEPMPSEDGSTAILTVIPATKPLSTETEDLVGAIRDSAAALRADTGATLLVTGQTAMGIDVSQKLDDALLPYLALVVGLAFLLLILVFRSLLVPLKAALGFLLSVLAALGAVVAVFQWGWLGGLFGVEETGPVMSLMPIFLVGVVFGLAMDYEVFLVTRMREAYVHGLPPDRAVVTGFRHGARVVTAAAVIMISVFAGFVGSDEPMIKMIGLGLAIAVFFDAFVVRMTLVPAVLGLLGRSAWWLPAWLDRALPDVDVEGEKLQQRLAGPDTGSRARESPVP
ncbi:MMPL family transporter [Streptomyces carpaticus]|uniref:MMPL family transporter n=1 Tax=Streptomyces carpaticus TaxID=285558 RepID=A0ABV4ZQ30_9ACTN